MVLKRTIEVMAEIGEAEPECPIRQVIQRKPGKPRTEQGEIPHFVRNDKPVKFASD